MVHAGVALPVHVPTLLACVLEGFPNTFEAAELEVVIGLLIASWHRCWIVERPFVGGTVVAVGAGASLRLEGLAKRRGEVCNLQTDRMSGIIGDSSKVRCPGEVVADANAAQGVLVIVVAKADREEFETRRLGVHGEVFKS